MQPSSESDVALLARFAALRDERAFAELMRRHGPMVMGACLRILRHRQDAEDALQAAFVTLSAKARSLRRYPTVAGWLHNVAVRISLNLHKMNRRREHGLRRLQDDRIHARTGELKRTESHGEDAPEIYDMLDEELGRLPARLKEMLILRDLEGYSRTEVAKKLGLPTGTVDSRLNRARKLLHDRLVRRGVTLGAGGLVAVLTGCAEASPVLGVELIRETYRNAQLFMAGTAAGKLSATTRIGSIAQGVLNTMFLTKLSTTVCIVAVAAALVLGASPLSTFIGSSSIARAQELKAFLDEFDDGSASDGNPIKWVPFDVYSNGTYRVEQQSFVLEPNAVTTPLVSLVDATQAVNVSIRTQVRVISGNSQGTALFARFVPGANAHAYQGGIESTGDVYIGWNGSDTRYHDLAHILTDLRPNQEDVMLQFDVFGNSLKLFAWRPNEPMPAQPTVTVMDDQFPGPGTIGLLHHPTGTGSGAFRFVQASPTPIPEPSTVALASFGFVALAAFGARSRLLRPRSAHSFAEIL